MNLDKDYIEVKAENKKLSEKNSKMNLSCKSLEQKLQLTTTQHENTIGKSFGDHTDLGLY